MGIETDLGWKEVTLFRELLSVFNCFQHSVPAPWVHFFTSAAGNHQHISLLARRDWATAVWTGRKLVEKYQYI